MNTITYSSQSLLAAFTHVFRNVKNRSEALTGSLILLSTLSSGKVIHLLLADDDRDDRDLFKEALSEAAPNVEVTFARDGEELMDMLNSANAKIPDIIFLDLNMPHKNGHECLEEIRSIKKLKDVPVIIYSTSSNRSDIERTFRHGATRYITKPSSFSELRTITKKFFSINWNEAAPIKKIEKFVFK